MQFMLDLKTFKIMSPLFLKFIKVILDFNKKKLTSLTIIKCLQKMMLATNSYRNYKCGYHFN